MINSLRYKLRMKLYAFKVLLLSPCRLLPLQRKVVFVHFFGKNVADEPKYIFQALHKKDPTVKCIWIVQNPKWQMPEGLQSAKYMSLAAIYHWYTAKVWVDSCKTTYRTPKRKGQFFLDCWHGSVPLKQIEADVERFLSKTYLDRAKSDSNIIDLTYSNNDFMLDIYKKQFWYNGEVIKCDEPRVAILKKGSEFRAKVEQSFPEIEGKKIIVYAPTFRNNSQSNIFFWDYQAAKNACEEKFGGNFVFLIKLHPNIINNPHYSKFPEGAVNASHYPDVQELMAVADVVITDYSSVMFEFGMTGKPVFLYCPDLKEYTSADRPLYFDIKQLPFPVSESESALMRTIQDFDSSNYTQKLTSFYDSIHFEDSGHGDEYIADLLLSKLNVKEK